jgi:hypothetical protein
MIIHAGVPEVEAFQVTHRSSLDGLGEVEDRSPTELGDLGEIEGHQFEFILDGQIFDLTGFGWPITG